MDTTISHGADFEIETEQRLRDIGAELTEIKETLAFIKETIVKADTTITTVAAEVMPTITQLMENPMIKMIAGKKK